MQLLGCKTEDISADLAHLSFINKVMMKSTKNLSLRSKADYDQTSQYLSKYQQTCGDSFFR
jgi:hypothetical protein